MTRSDANSEASWSSSIPWRLVAVSPDMIDTTYCNKKYPFVFRSSLAIFTYEPPDDDVPTEYQNQQISYLKVSCSITGFHPSKQDVKEGLMSFPSVPTEELKRVLTEYFGCYGAMLNVAVFPPASYNVNEPSPANYPFIIDFEPKSREIVQAATDKGEIIWGSFSKVKTDKSLTSTNSSSSLLDLAAKYAYSPAKDKGGSSLELSGKTTQNYNDKEEYQRTVSAEASRERKETEGVTANISQMYNILTGYHIGTNRASFVILPRPHIVQPTNRRTFAQGLRVIEGIQEFFLVVTRPVNMTRYCIEATLESGHFPEKIDKIEPELKYKSSYEDFLVRKTAQWGHWGSDRKSIDTTYTISNGWMIDRSKGDPGCPGISMIQDKSNGQAKSSLQDYSYRAKDDGSAQVEGSIQGSGFPDYDNAEFERLYRVHTRTQVPIDQAEMPEVTTKFIITSRSLCVCLGYEINSLNSTISSIPESIVDTQDIAIPFERLEMNGSNFSLPPVAYNEVNNQVQAALTSSWRRPSRTENCNLTFLTSDYFKQSIRDLLAPSVLRTKICDLTSLDASIIKLFENDVTVDDVLALSLESFSETVSMNLRAAADCRKLIMQALCSVSNGDTSFQEQNK